MRSAPLAGAAMALCVVASGLFTASESAVSPANAAASNLLSGASLSGTIAGGELPAGSLTVSIKQGNWRDLPQGSSFELYPVAARDIQIVGNTWSVSLDPATIPAKFVAADGQLDF